MKKTYIAPNVRVEEAEVDSLLMVTSIQLSNESGSEEYAKGAADDGEWDIEW